MTRPLLHHPIPYPDESPGSLLLRATEMNGWKSISSLLVAQRYKFSINSTINLESIVFNNEKWNEVCDLFGMTEILGSFSHYKKLGGSVMSDVDFLGIPIPQNKLTVRKLSICTKCISENNYLKKIWDFKLITTCSKHKIKLTNYCFKCNKRMLLTQGKIKSCSCGYSFINTPERSVHTETTEYIEKLIILKNKEKLDLLLAFHSAYEELFLILGVIVSKYDLAYLSAISITSPSEAVGFIKNRFLKIILTKNLHPRIILHPLLSSNRQQLPSLAKSIIKEIKYLPLKSKGAQRSGAFNNKKASCILGISLAQLKILKQSNILKKPASNDQLRLITLESLNELLNICSNTNIKYPLKYQLVTLDKYLHSYQSQYTFEDLIHKILNEQISFSGKNINSDGLKSILIEVNLKPISTKKPTPKVKRKRKVKPQRKTNCLTIKETAKLCNVNYENIRFAIHCKILKKANSTTKQGVAILISNIEANKFNEKYIFTGALARKYGVTPTNLTEKIMSFGIKPISGPRIDGGLCYIFKRKEVEDFDANKLRSIKGYQTKTGRRPNNKPQASIPSGAIPLRIVAIQLEISIQKASRLIERGILEKYPDYHRRVVVTKKSYDKLCSIRADTSLVLVSKAAKSTGESEGEFRARWLYTGFVPVIYTGLEAYISFTDLKKIRCFKRSYITEKEASKITNTYRGHLNYYHDIKPAKQFCVGNNLTISFYSRKKVLRYYNLTNQC